MGNTKRLLWMAGFIGILAGPAHAAYVDADPSSACSVRVHYPTPVVASPEVFVLGVGTAMSRSDYDVLAGQIVGKGYVVVLMDHAPGNLVKTDATAFRNCVLTVKAQLPGWLAPAGFVSAAHWFMGGHSAGGQAAQYAVAADPSLGDGIFSIDPYDLSSAPTVNGPALYWGFNVTTCFVNMDAAAKAGYYRTSGHRAFVRVKKVYSFNPCGYSPKYFHCSFADGHCPACTNCMLTPSSFFTDIANSVQKFVNAAFYGAWSKAALTTSMTTPTDFFVDGDLP